MLGRVMATLHAMENRIRLLARERNHRRYLKSDRLPWTPGYDEHKRRQIAAHINNPHWQPETLPAGHGFRLDERVVEYPWFFSRLPEESGRLLDAGSVLNFDYLVAHPKLANKTLTISTLAPESEAFWKKGISYVYEDLRDSGFRDAYFDWVCCLSTLEHIGLDNTMLYTSDRAMRENRAGSCLDAVRELRRLLKPGGRLFLSVPFGRAANHGWFQVFDSSMIDQVVAAFSPSQVTEIVYRYLPEGWTVSNRAAAADATYFDIHKQKNYDADYAAASRAVICLEMVR